MKTLLPLTLSLVISITASSSPDNILLEQTNAKNDKIYVHEKPICSSCHKLRAEINQTIDFRFELNSQCRTCHNGIKNSAQTLSSQFHKNQDKLCIDCHSFHSTSTFKVEEISFEHIRDERTQFICQSCHTPGGDLDKLSSGHLSAKAYFHSNLINSDEISPSEACQACHGTKHSPYSSQSSAYFIFLTASHPLNTPISATAKFKQPTDKRIRLYNNKIVCQSCHSLSSGTSKSLIKFEKKIDLCLECHKV